MSVDKMQTTAEAREMHVAIEDESRAMKRQAEVASRSGRAEDVAIDTQRLVETAARVADSLIPEELFRSAIERRDYEEMRRWHDVMTLDPSWKCDGELMRAAVEEGNDSFVLWHLMQCPHVVPVWLDSWVMTHSRLEVLKHLVANKMLGIGGVNGIITSAASKGSMDIIEWLHENVSKGWTADVMDMAACRGQLGVVQWLHANRTEGCTTWAMDWAARYGHLDVVKWLHDNRTEGCTTEAMNAATQNGHVHLVKWLHLNRMEATSASPMTAFISERNIALVREMYDGDDPYFWPRPGDMPTLVMLVQSKDAVDQEILKTITSCRRERYCPDGPENPEEYMLVQHDQPLYPTRDAIQHDKSFYLTLVAVVSRRWSLPRETSQLISQFVMPHPTKKLTREDAVRRVLVHWLVSFSSFPSEDMMALAEISHIDAACWMLDRLQRDGRVQCSKRLMYLTVEKGSLDIIKWHVLNCGAHDINEWLYVATWIGRVDAVKWMVGECPEINAERSIHKQLQLERQHVTQQIQDKPRKVILTRKTMFHSLDASFAEVEERFAAGLMDVEATMNDAEKSAQR